jgi:hypothetical protein
MFDGKMVGDEALKKQFSYDTEIPGLQALDRYTLRIRLKEPDNNFLFYMAMPGLGVVAREVIEAYPGQAGNHPVGTGPFMIGDWKHSDRIVLLANPDPAPCSTPPLGEDPEDRALAAALEGQAPAARGPRRSEDRRGIPGPHAGLSERRIRLPRAGAGIDDRHGDPRRQAEARAGARGMQLSRFPVLQTYYMWMNMEDPVVGGYTKDRIALRRAISLSLQQCRGHRPAEEGLCDQGRVAAAAQRARLRPGLPQPGALRPGAGQRLLDRHGYGKRDPTGFGASRTASR